MPQQVLRLGERGRVSRGSGCREGGVVKEDSVKSVSEAAQLAPLLLFGVEWTHAAAPLLRFLVVANVTAHIVTNL